MMRKEIRSWKNMQYVVRYPKGYLEGKKYPVILFLHGAGSRGTDINLLLNNPFFQLTDIDLELPFVTVAPQCSANTWFDLFETLERFVKELAVMPFVDSSKIYLIGASMGGYATWQLAMSLPEYFAAIVPICGGGMYWNAGRLVNVPVWAFHGQKDTVVFSEESAKMVEAVKRSGGDARLTMYPENAHDAWSDTYRNPKVFEWLLTNENQNAMNLTDKYEGSDIYG